MAVDLSFIAQGCYMAPVRVVVVDKAHQTKEE